MSFNPDKIILLVTCERISRRNAYYVKFPFNEQLVERIKELPEENRKWNPTEIAWEVKSSSLMSLIRKYKGSEKIYFDFGSDDNKKKFIELVKKDELAELEKQKAIQELEIKKKHWVEYKKYLEENYEQFNEMVHKNLKEGVKLYPHQIQAVMFFNEIRSGLLALEMGTGKSLTSIALAELNKFDKVFVIVPNCLKFNYLHECERFTKNHSYIIGWNKNKYTIAESKYIIVNYDYFNGSDKEKRENKIKGFSKKVVDKFNKLEIGKIDCLIFDESQKISNVKSQTFLNIKKIFTDDIFRDKKVSKIYMSGSPAPNKIGNLWGQLNGISPLDFPTKTGFLEKYCGMVWNPNEGWVYEEEKTRYEELFRDISPYMFRKKKKDVLKDLPDVIIQKVVLEMTPSEYQIYLQLERGIANEFINEDVFNPATKLLRLKQYTSHLKTKNVSELIDIVLETPDKLVIVDFFKDGLYDLFEKYKNVSVLHTGDVKKTEDRDKMIYDFQNNEKVKIFFGSSQTISIGLTLTAANKIGVLTIPWNWDDLDQQISRLQRLGQKDTVNAYLFIYKDSIDEYTLNVSENKKRNSSIIIDGEKYVSNIESDVIDGVIGIIKEKHKIIEK
jgi:non-specific serine/threonine protein kinase